MAEASGQLRYAILRHEGVAEPHFDLLFETEAGSALESWRSAAWPIDRPTGLTRLPEHRREYLSYEGPVSGGRGRVRQVEGGTCERVDSPGQVLITLGSGQRLRLRREEADRWQAEPVE